MPIRMTCLRVREDSLCVVYTRKPFKADCQTEQAGGAAGPGPLPLVGRSLLSVV